MVTGASWREWGIQLAEIDGVEQGVLTSPMGTALLESVGFRRVADVSVPGDEEDPEGFPVAVLRYDPY